MGNEYIYIQLGSRSYRFFLNEKNLSITHGVMIGVCHGIGNLGPAHAILDGHLVRRAAYHWHLYRAAARRHVSEDGRADLLLLVPPTTPRTQAHQRQHDDGNGRHGRADRHAQHFAVDLALGSVKRTGTPGRTRSVAVRN